MNQKLLIISPYFPAVNSADMQRIRMSLPYFSDYGWDSEVVMIHEDYTDMSQDLLLLQSVPTIIKIHKIKAFKKQWTSKIGLGSIALRSIWHYRQKVNELLKYNKYDLIYFSTTQFPVCILGSYWKKRFNIPYVIDMQDPWHSDYHKNNPQKEKPSKYWFSYYLNKYLEPLAIKNVDGLISVSENYINDLKGRYPIIKDVPSATITFGAFEADLQIAQQNSTTFNNLLDPNSTNIVYIGRGGNDMHKAITPVFEALKNTLSTEKPLKIYFIGTSYAPNRKGIPTILPLARQFGVENQVIEITDRIGFYHTLATLQQAHVLFIPGSDDPKYTASKIYPYLLTGKPLLTLFNKNSNMMKVLNECTENASILTFNDINLKLQLDLLFAEWTNGTFKSIKLLNTFKNYSAQNLTGKQTELFDEALKYFENTSR